MVKIEKFEDLETWKRARDLVKITYGICQSGEFGRDFDLWGQIQRAAASVSSSSAEDFECDGNRECLQYLSKTKGSCGGVRSQLCNAFDLNYLTPDPIEALNDQCLSLGRWLAGFQASLPKSEVKGVKYRATVPSLEFASEKPKT